MTNSQDGTTADKLAALLWLVQNTRRSAEMVVAQTAAKAPSGSSADQAVMLVIAALCDAVFEMAQRLDRPRAPGRDLLDAPNVSALLAEVDLLRSQNRRLMVFMDRLANETVYHQGVADEGSMGYLAGLYEEAQALLAEVAGDYAEVDGAEDEE